MFMGRAYNSCHSGRHAAGVRAGCRLARRATRLGFRPVPRYGAPAALPRGPALTRRVKGTLFVDYVRMLRMHKDVDWSTRLEPADLALLKTRIEPGAWYPMDSFERLGLAILNVVAGGQLALVHDFGRASVDWILLDEPRLLAQRDPRESLMRFHVLRQSFFDYPALEVRSLTDREACIVIDYQMGPVAEEAAAQQTLGFFERLLEVAGATAVTASFSRTRWGGAPQSVLELRWR